MLHHQKLDAILVAHVVERADVRVVELRNGARFLLEASARLYIAGGGEREHFERDGAIEPNIARTIHLAHAAGAERLEDLVRTEPPVRFERLAASAFAPVDPK